MHIKEEMEITIMPDGKIKTVVKGIKGNECEKVGEFFKDLGKIIREEKTDEYYQKENTSQIVQKQNDIRTK